MAIRFLGINQNLLDKHGKELTSAIEKKMGQIIDAAEFMQKAYNKYDKTISLDISVYLDYNTDKDFFRLIIDNSGGKVSVWLEWNLEEAGHVVFDEFPCYDEKDFMRDSKKWEEYLKNKKDNQSYQNFSPGPSRIPV